MPLKLATDGKLAVSEADVERQVLAFLTVRGWLCIKTDAGKVTRGSGRSAHAAGTLDYVCVRARNGYCPDVLFLELKGRLASTDRKRKKQQDTMARSLRARRFPVCHMPDMLDNPIEWFKEWYEGTI